MTTETQAIVEAALALPEADRVLVVERLLKSLPPENDTDNLDDDEFFAELERRSLEFASDPSAGIPWSEVKRQT
ncbi:MAG TPA: addiction module protein [Pirellulales bacterium]|jgi:putative addiction module component (TIGR02574 family)|nr:addiction module protein [Pirellulales bacterium]